MTEYEALATAAVKALEAASTPTWTDIFGAIGAIGAIGVGLLQAGLIWYGLQQYGGHCQAA